MCGLVGVFNPAKAPDATHLRRLSSLLQHRGPDDEGVYLDSDAGFGVAHRRLAILDLSPAGHQPMSSPSGRYVMAYNGEIYNHLELRSELQSNDPKRVFRGTSDTETLLSAMDAWGVEETLKRCNGMFAFALWDKLERRLCLARDRMGEKPLYVGWLDAGIVFSSELKPILKVYPFSLDHRAVELMLSLGYVPAPWSIAKHVFKLPPSNYLWLDEKDTKLTLDIKRFVSFLRPYWSLANVANEGVAVRGKTTANLSGDAVNELERLLRDAIRLRMLSDVPLGACLSGGVDSASVAALMQSLSNKPIKTFTIGFEEANFNEAHQARQVAQYLGTDHVEAYLTANDALALIPELPKIYDEPFADSSQIPTLLLCQQIRQHVTVALSGDGGDELFCGYDRYRVAPRLWRAYGLLPAWLRRQVATRVQAVENYRLWRAARRLSASRFDDFYLAFSSPLPDPSIFVPGCAPLWDSFSAIPQSIESIADRMMYRDQSLYLPDDILTKVDRASMAVSLEMRVPFMDHRLLEWAWRQPLSLKYRQGSAKWLLKQTLEKYVPTTLFERPKRGFGIPIDDWLRGPLREWADSLLSVNCLLAYPQLDAMAVRELWTFHLDGKINAGYALWNALMLMAWLKEWRGCAS